MRKIVFFLGFFFAFLSSGQAQRLIDENQIYDHPGNINPQGLASPADSMYMLVTYYNFTPDGNPMWGNLGQAVWVHKDTLAARGFFGDGRSFIEGGANVVVTGDGTEGNPYIISAAGGGAGDLDSLINLEVVQDTLIATLASGQEVKTYLPPTPTDSAYIQSVANQAELNANAYTDAEIAALEILPPIYDTLNRGSVTADAQGNLYRLNNLGNFRFGDLNGAGIDWAFESESANSSPTRMYRSDAVGEGSFSIIRGTATVQDTAGTYTLTDLTDRARLVTSGSTQFIEITQGGHVIQRDTINASAGGGSVGTFVYELTIGENYNLPIDTLLKYDHLVIYASSNSTTADTAVVNLPDIPDNGNFLYGGKRIFVYAYHEVAAGNYDVVVTAPGGSDSSGSLNSSIRKFNCTPGTLSYGNDTIQTQTETRHELLIYTTVPGKAYGFYFRQCAGEGGGGTGWLKDSIAVANVNIPMNRNQLSFSSNIPFGISTDTLISLTTPRSDPGLNPHYLVFNFGSNSAGFVEEDSNFSFFNTVNGEGLSYAGDYFNSVSIPFLQDRQIPDIQTVNRLITNSITPAQTLSRTGTDITLSDGGGTVSIADNDNDPANELQTVSLSNAGSFLSLTISDGNTSNVSLATDNTTITGNGTTATPFEVNTSVIATQTYVDERIGYATTNSLPNASPFNINLQNRFSSIYELQMVSAPSPLTLTVSNPENGGVYTFHFLGVTSNDIVFPANFYYANETSIGTLSLTESDFLTCYYSGANFYCK